MHRGRSRRSESSGSGAATSRDSRAHTSRSRSENGALPIAPAFTPSTSCSRRGSNRPSLVSRTKLEQRIRVERSRDRKENTHGDRSSHPGADPDRRRTRYVGTLGTSTNDGASVGPARPTGVDVRERPHEHAGRARAAADQTDGRQMAESVSDGASGWLAG